MKKSLVLALVVAVAGFASVSQAAISIGVAAADQKPSYSPSDVILLEVTSDVPLAALSFDLNSSHGGTANNPAIINPNFDNAFGAPGTVVNAGGLLIQSVVGILAGVTDVPVAGLHWVVEYHVPQVPPSTEIQLFATNNQSADGTFSPVAIEGTVIHVIPEPMTMSLLGLGGLALARRRRA